MELLVTVIFKNKSESESMYALSLVDSVKPSSPAKLTPLIEPDLTSRLRDVDLLEPGELLAITLEFWRACAAIRKHIVNMLARSLLVAINVKHKLARFRLAAMHKPVDWRPVGPKLDREIR